MTFFKKIFKSKIQDEFTEAPEGVCPNCWGDQEYGNVVREKFKDTQIDVNNGEAKYAFIQDFVVTHMKGIKLKSTVHGSECSSCKITYKK
jgi:hypothetical protein